MKKNGTTKGWVCPTWTKSDVKTEKNTVRAERAVLFEINPKELGRPNRKAKNGPAKIDEKALTQ